MSLPAATLPAGPRRGDDPGAGRRALPALAAPTLRPAFAAQPRGPHPASAVLALVAVDLLVVGLLLLSWFQASRAAQPASQIGWLDLAGASLLLGAGAHTGWLLAGRRAVGRRSRALALAVAALLPGPGQRSGLPPAEQSGEQLLDDLGDDDVLVVEATSHHHRPGCPLLVERLVHRVPQAEATASGRRPCPFCAARTAT